MKETTFLNLFGKFCITMQVELPVSRVDQYNEMLSGFSEETLSEAFREWAMNHPPRFMPAPNDLHISCIEISSRAERKGGPKTVQDLFGNKVRVETPLARELRRIFKAYMGYPVYKKGEILRTGVITHKEAMEMVAEAEAKYGLAHGEEIPKRKTVDECLEDAYADISMAIRGQQKHDAHQDHKLSEQERDTLRDIARQLLPNGHFIVRAKEKNLVIESFADDVWQDSYDTLQRMGESI